MPTHHRVCHLCEAMCGLTIEHDGAGHIASIKGDPDDPFSRGYLCPKAYGLKDIHEDPDRLHTPMRRVGGPDDDRWEPVGWDEALDEVARRLLDVQREHGRDAVAFYQGNPTVHNYAGALFGQFFSRALGSKSRYSATSVDQLPHMLAALEMFGHQLLLPIPDIDRTDLFVVFGANPMVSNGSLMTAPDMRGRLRALRERGGRLIVLDPRRTETAELADEHHFVRPGSDAFLIAALVNVLLADGRCQLGPLAPFTDGLDALTAAVAGFTPAVVAPHVGLPADTITALARQIADARSAAIYGRVGVSTQSFGGIACWLLYALSVITRNLDRPGGVMFTHPAFDLVDFTTRIGQRGHFDRRRSRVRGLPEFGGEWPVATLADEIETPGRGQVRALVTIAGNPVLSAPNGARLDRVFRDLDFMVSLDIYRNETTRHANLILPTTFGVEHDHYDVIFHALAVRNTARYSLPMVTPAPTARHDWQVLLGLATRLASGRGGLRASLGAKLQHAALSALGPAGIVDLGLRLGPYGRSHRLSLAHLGAHPHGVDLGPLTARLPGALRTRDRRLALAPPRLVADMERLRAALASPAPAPGQLALIGRRELRSNNSWMHNSDRLVRGPVRCQLRMHPDDARDRGLTAGSLVRVRSRTGAVEATLEVSDELMPGVVSLPHGWGHGRRGTALRVASAHPGVSLNDLTDDALVDTFAGTAAFNGVPVTVEATSG